MSKHVGIVACSAEGAALCYRTICIESSNTMGEYYHPEITMHTHSLGEYMEYIPKGNWDGVANLMLSSTSKVAKAGAEFAICPDNTIHQAFDKVVNSSPIPWLHIAEEVGREAKEKGYKKLGVLGTKFLMGGPVYLSKLKDLDIDSIIPDDNQRKEINNIIFQELVNGIFKNDSRLRFNEIISSLKNKGCDAVVLGCTEIPLIVIPEKSSLPVLDSTRILARAAIKYSVI